MLSVTLANKLNYTDAGAPGYSRKRVGDDWVYFDVSDKKVRSPAIIRRLNALSLPPAYRDAWFARDPRSHVQATGIDDKGRKQYRYHADFISARESEKYAGCIQFGIALPAIRKRVEIDLARRDLSRDRVIAAVVRLLDLGSVRIGNASYAKANRSYGATTLRNRHAKIRGSKLMLNYVGKSGKSHNISIEDSRLARLVRRCQELPGQTLFQYVGSDDVRRPVTSADVNTYLRECSGDFTAKHFRTWAASVLAFDYITTAGERSSLKAMLAQISEKLGNTPAIARKSYVHPALIDAVRNGSDIPLKRGRAASHMSGAERGLIHFLETQAQRDAFGTEPEPNPVP